MGSRHLLILVATGLLPSPPSPQEIPEWRRFEQALRPPKFKNFELTFWPDFRPIIDLAGPEADKALERFAEHPEELGLKTNLDRVLLQRSVWAFFDAHSRSWRRVDPDNLDHWLDGPPKQQKPVRKLEQAAKILKITTAGLKEEDVRALPDSYARTLDSKTYAEEFDESNPGRPFLPPGLLKLNGPWICLGSSTDVPLALHHLQYFGVRSTFLVFFRVPGGREAGLAFAKVLQEDLRKQRPEDPLPQMPAGTQVALVEQCLVVTADRKIIPSPLVETVQLRVYRKPDRPFDFQHEDSQAVFVFRLVGDLLRSEDRPPLRALGKEESDWEPAFVRVELCRSGPWDMRSASPFFCTMCHGAPGTESLLFHQDLRLGFFQKAGPRKLDIVTPPSERERIARWKEKDETWKDLESFWR